MAINIRSMIFRFFIYIAFFASGAASLIAEVTWNRMLIVVVGNSMTATAMLIVVFMGGLGSGSYVGGKIFSKYRVSMIPYILLETAIGVYVFLSPTLFAFLARLFTSLAENVDHRAGLTFMRLLVTMTALFLPAFLMGGTFPAIINGAAPKSPSLRTARTGYLYSINTIGAAIGCFAAGYHLLFEFGVQVTIACAAGLYGIAVLCAFIANRITVTEVAGPEITPVNKKEPASVSLSLRRFLIIATFGIGFVALSYEVLLTRLGILYLGNTVSVFPLVLTAFLLGTGTSAVLGTWLYGVVQRNMDNRLGLFGITSLVAGFFVVITPYLLLTDWVLSTEEFARFADAAPRNPLPILLIMIAPTMLIGALLPMAIRILQAAEREEATREASKLYALNTIGGLVGAGLANHYLVPLVGLHGVIIFLALILTLIAYFSFFAPRRNSSWWSAVIIFTALAVVLPKATPEMMDLYAQKIAESTGARSSEVLLVHEGKTATVAVLDQEDPKKGSYRDMYLNGVEEASTRYWHTQLFKLLGILPVIPLNFHAFSVLPEPS